MTARHTLQCPSCSGVLLTRAPLMDCYGRDDHSPTRMRAVDQLGLTNTIGLVVTGRTRSIVTESGRVPL